MSQENKELVKKYRSDLIRQFRRALKLSQAEVAEIAGVSQTTIQKAERGEDIKITTLSGIAFALGVDRRTLLDMDAKFNLKRNVNLTVEKVNQTSAA